MALVLKDRVKETTTTTGTGTITLAGAVTGYQAFSVIGNANTTYYCIAGGSEWEVGIGTYTLSGTTLARTTILSSSNAGAAVNFSVGSKDVFVVYPAGKAVYGLIDDTLFNIAISNSALGANTTGARNLAAGAFALDANTTANDNVAVGYDALGANTTGFENVAVGNLTLKTNTTGTWNAAVGHKALEANTTGTENTAVGYWALNATTTGSVNTALGSFALFLNTTGTRNTAVGWVAMGESTGSYNTAVGEEALYLTTGDNNTAVGVFTLSANTTGTLNTAIGYGSGSAITTGTKNSIIGAYTGNQGGLDIRTASNYIVLSDGDGNPRAYWNGANATFGGGLAVTGTLSASGSGSVATFSAGGAYISFTSGNDKYIGNADVIVTGGSPNDLGISAISNVVVAANNGQLIGTFSSTGLAVTGLISATSYVSAKMNGSASVTSGLLLESVSGTQRGLNWQFGAAGDGDFWMYDAGGLGWNKVLSVGMTGGLAVTGAVTPSADNAFALGSSGSRWSAVYATALSDGGDQLVGSSGTSVRLGYGASWTAVSLATGGSERVGISSAGLAVTGALSATGALTVSGAGLSTVGGLTTGAYFSVISNVPAGTFISNVVAASGADRNIFQAAVSGVSNGFTVNYAHATTSFTYTFNNAAGNTVLDNTGLAITGVIEGAEQTAPSAPAANGYRIFAEDNGSGKTRLMVRFATGASQQIAIEP